MPLRFVVSQNQKSQNQPARKKEKATMANNCKRTAQTVTVMESSPSASSPSSSSSSTSSDIMFKRRRTACLSASCPLNFSSPDMEVQVEHSNRSFKFSSAMRGGSPVNSLNSGDVSNVSCCSCDEEASKVVNESPSSALDLEAIGFKTKDSTHSKLISFSTLSEVSGDSGEFPSSPELPSPRRNFPTLRTPPQDEIEEFFSVAEKKEQKRFAEKYNFDVVKDAPLEGGRYLWVRLP